MPSEGLTESLPVRMDKDLRKRLKSIAAQEDRDEAWVVRKALKEYLDRLDGSNGKQRAHVNRH